MIIENVFSGAGLINCGAPQGSILGLLLFLIYINDSPQTLNETGSYLYADDTCNSYQDKDFEQIEGVLNKEFSSLCEWFIDNKLSIHVGDDKTVEYLRCYLDSNLNGKSMTCRVLKRINTKLNFLWRQSNYLNYSSRRFLCHALIQPHFHCGCTSWYPLLSKALKIKLQIAQNKCIPFCLEFPPRGHISLSHFRKIDWLPVEHRVELCTSTTVFKYWKGIAPSS